jgi:hypothetical protein
MGQACVREGVRRGLPAVPVALSPPPGVRPTAHPARVMVLAREGATLCGNGETSVCYRASRPDAR